MEISTSYRPRIEVPEVNENQEYDPESEDNGPEDISPLDFHDDKYVNWSLYDQMGFDHD